MSSERETAAAKPISWRAQAAQLAAIVAVVFIAKGALAEPFYVPSGSMEPTLLIGDALLASKFPYGYGAASLNPDHAAGNRPLSARRRSAATSWYSAHPATARRPGSSASSACPATAFSSVRASSLSTTAQRP